jgi:hypothetical protein
MNFTNILADIEKTDPEVYEKLSDRRQALKSFGTKVAVAALPFAIGSLFKKAYGQTSSVVVDSLNFALELEYLEYNFYRTANNTGGLIIGRDVAGFQSIEAHEKAHITFLIDTITTLGGVPFTPKNYIASAANPMYVPSAYDFTAGGTYAVLHDYPTFLMVAQLLEDAGVHAYKGQIPEFLGNELLTQVMRIQSTEARHASFIRLMRRFGPTSAPEYPAPWISNNIPPTIPTQPYYLGEDNTMQTGVEIASLTNTNYSDSRGPKISLTAAFDEGYDKATIKTLVAPFIKI